MGSIDDVDETDGCEKGNVGSADCAREAVPVDESSVAEGFPNRAYDVVVLEGLDIAGGLVTS